MKIISNSIEGWVLELMCKGCNSIMGVEAGDVRCAANSSYHPHSKRNSHSYHVICPVCDTKCKLENLPKPVEVKARNRKDIDMEYEPDPYG